MQLRKISILLACVLALVCLFALAACDEPTTPTECETHTFSEWQAAQAPTCTEAGMEKRTCTVCEDQEFRPVNALGHSYGEWENAAPATCEDEGKNKRACATCGETEERPVAALGHDEINHGAKAPACTEKGWDAYVTCSRCDYTTYAEKGALGHQSLMPVHGKAASCLESGLTDSVQCTDCNTFVTPQQELAALGHDYASAWTYDANNHYHACTREGCEDKVDTAAHTYDGELDADCNVCGAIRVVICSHPTTDTITGYAATCTATGKTDGTKCTACGETLTAQQIIAALGHNEQNHAAQAPTCTAIGWDAYTTCKREGCAYTTFAPTAALGHDEQGHAAQAPTCTVFGWDAYVTCKRAGCNYTTYARKAALGHDKQNHAAQAATCTVIGWDAYATCNRAGCNYTTYAPIAALGHDEENHPTQEPTCTAIGWNSYVTCKRIGCDYNTYTTEKPPAGHSYDTVWSYDANAHYHHCTRGDCTAKTQIATHIVDSEADTDCNVCGAVRASNASTFVDKVTSTWDQADPNVMSVVDRNSLTGIPEFYVWYHPDGTPVKPENLNGDTLSATDYATINPVLFEQNITNEDMSWEEMWDAYGAYLKTRGVITYNSEWTVGTIVNGEYKLVNARAFAFGRNIYGCRMHSKGYPIATNYWDSQFTTSSDIAYTYIDALVAAGKNALQPGVDGKIYFADVEPIYQSDEASAPSYQFVAGAGGFCFTSGIYALRPDPYAPVALTYTVPTGVYGTAHIDLGAYINYCRHNEQDAYFAISVNDKVVWPTGGKFEDSKTWYTWEGATLNATTLTEMLKAAQFYVKAGDEIRLLFARGTTGYKKISVDLKPTIIIDRAKATENAVQESSLSVANIAESNAASTLKTKVTNINFRFKEEEETPKS